MVELFKLLADIRRVCYTFIMYKQSKRRKQLRRLALIYTLMTVAVVAVVSLMVLFVLGYRFDTKSYSFKQTGLVQFNTQPTGAVVEIDQKKLNSKTATKRLVAPGVHEFAMWSEGYETWWKQLDVKAGSLTWLDYARLIPKQRVSESVRGYQKLDDLVFAPGGRFAAVLSDKTKPSLELVNLKNDKDIKAETVELPTDKLAQMRSKNVRHEFKLVEWDQSGRYLLIRHDASSNPEWLLFDRENPEQLVNITSTVELPIDKVQLVGSDGRRVVILSEGTVRRVDLDSGEISRGLASKVDDFSLYGRSVITYVGRLDNDSHQKVVGLVRDGDNAPHILKTIKGANSLDVNVSTAQYFNHDYVAISVGPEVEILSGQYPHRNTAQTADEAESSLKPLTRFKLSRSVKWLEFSGNGRFVTAQDERGFMSYDLERRSKSPEVDFDKTVEGKLRWLDSYHIWTVENGRLIMQDFDGANRYDLAGALAGYDANYSDSGKYIYYVEATDKGFSLARFDLEIKKK